MAAVFKGRFTYIICEAKISEEEAATLAQHVEGIPSSKMNGDRSADLRLSRERHADCYSYYDDCVGIPYVMHDQAVGGPVDLKGLAQSRLPLQILRVCRQAYVEANPILWGTTIWSFTHSLAFAKFMEGRNAAQRRVMCKLHLDLDIRYHWQIETWAYWWWSRLNKSVLKKFSALKVIYLDITGNQWVRNSGIIGRPPGLKADLEFNMLSDIHYIAPKVLTITCMETFNTDGSIMSGVERSELANEIRRKLMDRTKKPYSYNFLTFSQD